MDQTRRDSRRLTIVGVHPSSPTAVGRINRAARLAARLLFTAGSLSLGYTAYVAVDARAYQRRARAQFDAVRESPAGAPAPISDSNPADGSTIGEIRIRRLGLSAMIVQGDSPSNLRRAVGHLADTSLPGEPGNVVLAGHRDTFFRALQHIRTGDTITVRAKNADYAYRVDSMAIVSPDAVEVLAPTAQRALTLVTCFPFTYVGAAPNRFIVRASQADQW